MSFSSMINPIVTHSFGVSQGLPAGVGAVNGPQQGGAVGVRQPLDPSCGPEGGSLTPPGPSFCGWQPPPVMPSYPSAPEYPSAPAVPQYGQPVPPPALPPAPVGVPVGVLPPEQYVGVPVLPYQPPPEQYVGVPVLPLPPEQYVGVPVLPYQPAAPAPPADACATGRDWQGNCCPNGTYTNELGLKYCRTDAQVVPTAPSVPIIAQPQNTCPTGRDSYGVCCPNGTRTNEIGQVLCLEDPTPTYGSTTPMQPNLSPTGAVLLSPQPTQNYNGALTGVNQGGAAGTSSGDGIGSFYQPATAGSTVAPTYGAVAPTMQSSLLSRMRQGAAFLPASGFGSSSSDYQRSYQAQLARLQATRRSAVASVAGRVAAIARRF
jgi:hypothetical protein